MFNINSRSRYAWVAILLLLLGIVLALSSVPKLRMGLAIFGSKATGSLPDAGWMDLFMMVRSGTHFNLRELAETPNPYSTITNPYDSTADISVGTELFHSHCATCHGAEGLGGPGGPELQHRRMVQGSSDWALFRTVSLGSAEPPCQLVICPGTTRSQLAAYLRSLMLRSERRPNSRSRPRGADAARIL